MTMPHLRKCVVTMPQPREVCDDHASPREVCDDHASPREVCDDHASPREVCDDHASPREVCDDHGSSLWQHLLLLCSEPLHQLPPHHHKHRAQKTLPKYESGIVFVKTLTEHWNMTEAHPPVQIRGGEWKM